MADPQRLSVETLEELLPGDVVTIGMQEVLIRPLGLLSLGIISRKIKVFIKELSDRDITLENCKSPENIIDIASELLERFPEVLASATNIHVEDIKQLPVDTIVVLLDKVIDVNMKSNDSFLGNLNSLTSKFKNLIPTETKGKKNKNKK